MPKIWDTTIEAHKRAVCDAVIDATATLAATQGLASVTMSRIAQMTGIGRATLYKYFPDVDAILVAWHERHVRDQLDRFAAILKRGGEPMTRLEEVLEAFALMLHKQHSPAAALLHRSRHVAEAHDELVGVIRDLLAEGVRAGQVRRDAAPEELATFCLHALTAANALKSQAGVKRLVQVTLSGLKA